MASFILAMVLHPEKQRRAQAELDEILGRGVLPTFGDRELLPYVDAVIKECFRYLSCSVTRGLTDGGRR